jgi:hypothetical protein
VAEITSGGAPDHITVWLNNQRVIASSVGGSSELQLQQLLNVHGTVRLVVAGRRARPSVVAVVVPAKMPNWRRPQIHTGALPSNWSFRRGSSGAGTAAGANSSPGTADPSGVAMPTGNLPGWHQVFADNFTGRPIDQCWGAYSGVPGSSPSAYWTPSHVVVSDGIAQLKTYPDPAFGGRWVTGGVSSAGCLKQTYGKYEIRFKIDKADGVKYAILLWPATGSWPCSGEVDFGEDGGGGRTNTTLTDHYCNSSGEDAILPQVSIASDFSQWQTLGIEWTHNQIVWTLNGKTEATINSPHVPSGPMEMDVQTETNTDCTANTPSWQCINTTTPTTANLDIDWVVAYAPIN